MGKYLDKTGLQYFYNKLKDKFADKSTIETKLDSLTGAFTWKGELSALPTDLSGYSAGNVIKVGTKEYVCTETNGTKAWDELGDEGSYLLKTAAESTYLKKAADEVKTDNLADGSVTKAKLDDSVQTSLGKADNSLQLGETNTQSKTTVVKTESTSKWESGIKVENKSDSTEITPKGITFGQYHQPIGIYHEASLKLKLDSASGSNIQLTGLATPTNDTDAVNKKYVDDKVSGFVKLGETNGASTSATTFKTNTTGQALNIQASDSTTYLNGISVSVGTRSSETAASLTKTALVFGKQGTNYGIVEVNSNNKLQITGLDTPTSDTDAANKKYVDSSVANKVDSAKLTLSLAAVNLYVDDDDSEHKAANINTITEYENNLSALGVDTKNGYIIKWYSKDATDYYGFGFNDPEYSIIHGFVCFMGQFYKFQYSKTGGKLTTYIYNDDGSYKTELTKNDVNDIVYAKLVDYQPIFDDQLKTTSHTIPYAINEVNTLAKAAVSKTNLVTSLQAITIYTDNTAANKAANLANIKAYEDNLKALGFTTTKDHNIPINIYGTTQKGFIGGNTSARRYHGIMGADNQWQMFVVTPDGTFASNPVLGGHISQLSTTNKTSTIAAINEVNTLAKSKASTAVATQSANGLMSAADKKKLDGALAAIANNASVNAIDIVSYDEDTNTYSGNAIEITGDIKSEINIKNHTYLAANSTVDGHIESLDIALKNVSDKVTNVATAANDAGKDAAAAQSALNTFKSRTEGFATAAQGTAASTALQTISASSDEYINATVEKKEGTSQVINVTASVATDITSASDTGEYLADAYAVKTYVDSKVVSGGSDMITLVYNDDDDSETTQEITDAQYKAITDAINSNAKPNIQVAYITGGEYNYMQLCYQFDDVYYFGSIYCDNSSIDYSVIFIVNATINSESSNGKHVVDMTFLTEPLINVINRIAANSNSANVITSGTSNVTLTTSSARNHVIAPTVSAKTFTLPTAASDGTTFTFTTMGQNSNVGLTCSSGIYNALSGKTATTYAASGWYKVTAIYSSTNKYWFAYKEQIS